MDLRGHYKPFNQNTFDKNDTKAKNAALGVLNLTEPFWYVNPDQYGPDLTDGFEFIEVEVKYHWTGSIFQFDTLHLPERKKKWRHLPIEYWILNREATHALVVDASNVKDEYLRDVPNWRFPNGGEYFFKVPSGDCRLIQLKR